MPHKCEPEIWSKNNNKNDDDNNINNTDTININIIIINNNNNKNNNNNNNAFIRRMQSGYKTCKVKLMLKTREDRYYHRKFEKDTW